MREGNERVAACVVDCVPEDSIVAVADLERSVGGNGHEAVVVYDDGVLSGAAIVAALGGLVLVHLDLVTAALVAEHQGRAHEISFGLGS